MRVLGVDPGLTRCGLGIIEGVPGRQLRMVAVQVVGTPSGEDIGARLLAVERQVEQWLDIYAPDAVAVERVFSQHNVRTVMGTAQAGAVAIVCAARRGVPVALHTPSEVKAAVTGSGRADKAQVTLMVSRVLRLDDPPRPADCADALALAICHLWRSGPQARLTAAAAQAGGAGRSPASRLAGAAAAWRAAQAARPPGRPSPALPAARTGQAGLASAAPGPRASRETGRGPDRGPGPAAGADSGTRPRREVSTSLAELAAAAARRAADDVAPATGPERTRR